MPFNLQTFTLFHVLLSLAGIVSGLVVAGGLASRRGLADWAAISLELTAATSITGFGFPANALLPSHVAGAISLVVLASFVWLGVAAGSGVRSAPAVR
jgi:hypothetical protein